MPGSRQVRHQLEEKGRLADAGRPCQEDHRARNQPPAEDSVHGGGARSDPVVLRIGDERSSRVGDQRDGITAPKPRDEPRRFLSLVVLVVGAQRSGDAVVIEQSPRVTCVFRNDERGRGKNLDRAVCHVSQIADGSTDQI